MESGFLGKLTGYEAVMVSPSGYTNEEILCELVDYSIEHKYNDCRFD
jgi:hypothetical protein